VIQLKFHQTIIKVTSTQSKNKFLYISVSVADGADLPAEPHLGQFTYWRQKPEVGPEEGHR